MPRPKGSKNKKPVQLAFDEQGNIAGTPGTVRLVDTTVTIPNVPYTQFIENEVISNMEITHALRTINQGNFAEIEHDMKTKFFDNGWRLFATHYVGQISEGIMILYILIREQ